MLWLELTENTDPHPHLFDSITAALRYVRLRERPSQDILQHAEQMLRETGAYIFSPPETRKRYHIRFKE